MLEKTMKMVLTKKINSWLESITDESVVNAIKKDLIITGGCFTSMLQNETPKDFDCYFRTKETVLKVANYYVNLWNKEKGPKVTGRGDLAQVFVLDGANPSQELLDFYQITDLKDSRSRMIANTPPERVKVIFPSNGIVGDPEEARASDELGTTEEVIRELDEISADEILAEEKKPYFPVFLSTNAITLSNGIQIVIRFYGEPNQIHETYDFVHTKAYFDIKDGKVVIPKEVYEAVMNKTLIYTGSKYPVCSIFRMRKFIERGWRINAGQILKACIQVSQLDLMDIDILEDQLIGVDSLYFMNLIEQFRKKKAEDPSWELTTNYVISIVDKIF